MSPSLKEIIADLFPRHVDEVMTELKKVLPKKPKASRKPAFWYKHAQLYVTYPDGFIHEGEATLATLAKKLTHIKKLGFTAVHVLPFFSSPLVDGGFDVSDYYHVRQELGGSEALKEFKSRAEELNLELFIDLVCNHVSSKHEWYKKAIAGDEQYRDYFIWTKEEPRVIEDHRAEDGRWITYEVFGTSVTVPIIFSHNQEKVPHWTQESDGNWYFHTFTAQQPDLNWDNPKVFIEFIKIMKYWLEKGFHFRLDAVPHLDKRFTGMIQKNTERTHQLIQALHQVAKSINPDTIFIVEVVDNFQATKAYLQPKPGQLEAETAYNFYTLNGMWAALILEDAGYLWQSLEETKELPHPSQWIHFLRSHDALMLGFINSQAPQEVFDALESRGKQFEGLQIAGRTFSLLGESKQRVITAHALLASLPGIPAFYYGDEFAKPNDTEFLEVARLSSGSAESDARNIGRGRVDAGNMIDEAFMGEIQQIFNTRNQLSGISVAFPEKMHGLPPYIWGCWYDCNPQIVEIYLNLSLKTEFTAPLPDDAKGVLALNGATVEENSVYLPPGSGFWSTRKKS